jgi:transitional endoplasmic reticulum ATPase
LRKSKQADTVGLSSIPGMSELKSILLEDVVQALRNVEEYKKYKITIPNGILFYGPPGCGKTFVAQRLANELDYNFFEVSPGTIASPYIHDSVLKIQSIFENAARSAPALIFVDEFEGLVPSRRTLGAESQYKAEEVNEWLGQIGSCAERNILFIAATNEPWKIDEAIQRTGRLDKKIYIGPPDLSALEEMLAFHLDGRPLANVDVPQRFAGMIDGLGYSASDVKAVVDEASKFAMRDRSPIECRHLERAAAERVPPSISNDTQELYMAFR